MFLSSEMSAKHLDLDICSSRERPGWKFKVKSDECAWKDIQCPGIGCNDMGSSREERAQEKDWGAEPGFGHSPD